MSNFTDRERLDFIIFRANRQFLARIIEEAIGREAIDAAMEAARLKPAPAPTLEELVKIWTDIAMSEDAQRCANGNKNWNEERAIGIRAIVERCGGRIAE